MEFHEKLMQLRKARGWSQEQLAEQLDVTRQTVSKWELGSTTPEMGKLMEMSRLFGISIDELVGNTAFLPPPEREEEKTVKSGSGHTWHYEYRSRRTLFGVPMVHINIGLFRAYRARGVIAVGNLAVGLLSLGLLSAGLLSLGLLSAGLLAIGCMTAGGISVGAVSAGIVSVGGLSIGIYAVGGFAIGVYALGGLAAAARIAVGGAAYGHIAIGDYAKGAYSFLLENSEFRSVPYEEVRAVVLREYPNIGPLVLWVLRAVLG